MPLCCLLHHHACLLLNCLLVLLSLLLSLLLLLTCSGGFSSGAEELLASSSLRVSGPNSTQIPSPTHAQPHEQQVHDHDAEPTPLEEVQSTPESARNRAHRRGRSTSLGAGQLAEELRDQVRHQVEPPSPYGGSSGSKTQQTSYRALSNTAASSSNPIGSPHTPHTPSGLSTPSNYNNTQNPPQLSPGFGGSTAASFFRSHLRAIAFTNRLSHAAIGNDGQSPTGDADEGGSGRSASDIGMTEEQFARMAETLSKDESVKTLKSLFESLQQFRTLLHESRTLAGSELQKEETFSRIVTRVRSVVAAEHAVLLMVDKTAEALYCSAATTPQGHVAYHTSLTHSFGGHVFRYKTPLNLKYSAEKDPRYDPDLAAKLGTKFRSILAVPVANKQGTITAVLLCINKRIPSSSSFSSSAASSLGGKSSSSPPSPYFSEQDQSLVEFVAVMAGSAIESALLLDEAVTRRHQTETLLQINELMAAETDTNKVMSRMIEGQATTTKKKNSRGNSHEKEADQQSIYSTVAHILSLCPVFLCSFLSVGERRAHHSLHDRL